MVQGPFGSCSSARQADLDETDDDEYLDESEDEMP